MKRPPLGIKPRWLMDEERLAELIGAFERHLKATYPIRVEWVQEYNEICERMYRREKK